MHRDIITNLPMEKTKVHEYEEAIDKKQSPRVLGESSFFWGLIKVPYVIKEEKLIHLDYCKHCGGKQFTKIHGYK
jgi:hypothetical protein